MNYILNQVYKHSKVMACNSIYIYILYRITLAYEIIYINNSSNIAHLPPPSLPGHDLRPRRQIPQGRSQAAAVSRHQHLRRQWTSPCHGGCPPGSFFWKKNYGNLMGKNETDAFCVPFLARMLLGGENPRFSLTCSFLVKPSFSPGISSWHV